MNFLTFTPVASGGNITGASGYTWYGPNVFVGARECGRSNMYSTWGDGVGAKLGQWNVDNANHVNLDLIGSAVSIFIHERAALNAPVETHWWKGTVCGYNPVTGKHRMSFQDYGEVSLKMSDRMFSIEASPCARQCQVYYTNDTDGFTTEEFPIYDKYRMISYEKKMYREKWDYKVSGSRVWHEKKTVELSSEIKLNEAASSVTEFIRNMASEKKAAREYSDECDDIYDDVCDGVYEDDESCNAACDDTGGGDLRADGTSLEGPVATRCGEVSDETDGGNDEGGEGGVWYYDRNPNEAAAATSAGVGVVDDWMDDEDGDEDGDWVDDVYAEILGHAAGEKTGEEFVNDAGNVHIHIDSCISSDDLVDLTDCLYPADCTGICCTESLIPDMVKTEPGVGDTPSDGPPLPRVCTRCSSKATRKCGTCKNVRYCDEYCQFMDWSSHKADCTPFKSVSI